MVSCHLKCKAHIVLEQEEKYDVQKTGSYVYVHAGAYIHMCTEEMCLEERISECFQKKVPC